MINNNINIEEIKKKILEIYRKKGEVKIIAHGDWDGVVGAGFLKKWIKENLNVKTTVDFPFKDLPTMILDEVITIETSNFAQNTKNSIIIDHHIQRKKIDPSNINIIDNENYDKSSVATLIVDAFQIQTNKEFLKAIEDIDNGRINLVKYILERLSSNYRKLKKEITQILLNAPLDIKLYASFKADTQKFPRDKISGWISKNNFNSLSKWASKKCKDFGKVMISVAKVLKRNIIDIPEADALIVVGPNRELNSDESQALKPAALYLQEKHKVVVTLILNENETVLKGTIGTFDPLINFENAGVYKALEKLPQIKSAGGRANIGGFQIKNGEAVLLDDLRKHLKSILKEVVPKK
ncbi:MAG: hypothetical protein ACFFAN_15520 [Promethearchaeota archaeon]